MNKTLILVPALLLIAAMFMLTGCGSSSTESKNSSLVTVSIGNSGKTASLTIRPATLLALADMQLKKAWRTGLAIAAGIPPAVKNVTITVTAANMATIYRNIPTLGQQEITDSFEVPNGEGRLFSVHALDSAGRSIYSAESLWDLFGLPVDISFDMNPDYLTVTPTPVAHGNISPANPQPVVSGSTTQFTITPETGFTIATPFGGSCPPGSLVGNAYTTGAITTDCNVEPVFETLYYTVTPTAKANGSISPATAQIVAHGLTQQFTVIPATGFTTVTPFGGTCPSGILARNTYTTGAITADCTVEPVFETVSYTVTPIAGNNGSISPATPQVVAHGLTQQFTIIPDNGYLINTVSGCGGTLSGNTYTTAPITGTCTVAADFSLEPPPPPPPPTTYIVTPVSGTSGSISPSSPQQVQAGSSIQFLLTPTSPIDSLITPVGGTCPQGVIVYNYDTANSVSYTTGSITSNCTVSPSFMYMIQ